MSLFSQTQIQTQTSNPSQITENFLNILKLCEVDVEHHKLHWIYISIIEKKPLIQIATEYLEKSNYDKLGISDPRDNLFDAYIKYKNGLDIDSNDAVYLLDKKGNLDMCVSKDDDGNKKIIFFNVRDLIKELDGNDFFDWVEKNSLKISDLDDENEVKDEVEVEQEEEYDYKYEDD